ncbi:MAG TPA: hypothetical protein VGV38_05615 [Pyrinomonadaceae bacterium]|nr:hypothetical protein [Pyrinomonadaceae bacterium]
MDAVYVCSNCKYKSAFYLSECPRCGRDQSFEDTSHAPPRAEPPAPPVTREPRTCHNYWCDYETSEPITRCPKCGRALHTEAQFRQLGWLLVALGGLLASAMAAVMAGAAYLFSKAGQPGWTLPEVSGPWPQVVVFGVTGLVLALGLAFAAAGYTQARTGRRNRPVMNIAIAIVVVLLALYAVVRVFAHFLGYRG